MANVRSVSTAVAAKLSRLVVAGLVVSPKSVTVTPVTLWLTRDHALTATDEAARAGAVTETNEGAKALLVKDEDGALRWMQIIDAEWEPRPVVPDPTPGKESFASRLTLEEVPR